MPVVRPPRGVAPARIEPGEPVVVRAPDALGDAVLALPALAALVERFGAHPLVVVAPDAVAPLYAGQRGVSEVVRAGGPVDAFTRLRRALGSRRGGLGIAFGGFAPAAALSGAGVRRIWGYGGPLSRLALDVALPERWRAGRHRWETYALLVAAATGGEVVERYPLAVGAGDESAADGLVAEVPGDGPLVGLAPGAACPSRRWPEERFADLATRLARRGVRVVVVGSPAEASRPAHLLAVAEPSVVDWTGRTPLPVLVACLRRLDLLVANDNGALHLAAAVGTPVVGLYGPSDEVETAPRGGPADVVVHPVACRPCRRPGCAYGHECLAGIAPATVASLVEARLEARRSAALAS